MEYSDPLVTEVRDACARLLFLDAWASAVDSGTCPACGVLDAEEHERESDDVPGYVEGLRDAFRAGRPCPACGREIPRAGAGDDWADVLAHLATPPEATAKADGILAGLGGEEATRAALDAWDTAVRPDDPLAEFEVDSESAERFGTLLGFQALGHGVGLGDDVRPGATWERPKVPHVEFGSFDFDGAALLGPAPLPEQVVDGETFAEVVDVLRKASQVVAARDDLADGRPAPFAEGQAFDDWAADLLDPAAAVLRRLGQGSDGVLARTGRGVYLDPSECDAVLDFLANVAPEDDTAHHLRERLRDRSTASERSTFDDLAKRAREEAKGLRDESDDWAYNGGEGPSPTDLDDWARTLDRCADALLGGPPADPDAFLAGIRGDLGTLAQEVDTVANGEGSADDLARIGASLRDLARRLGGTP